MNTLDYDGFQNQSNFSQKKKKKFTELKTLLGVGDLFIANHITFASYITDT